MTNLSNRVEKLEQQATRQNAAFLVYFDNDETLDQAKARYKLEHGTDLPDDALVICFTSA